MTKLVLSLPPDDIPRHYYNILPDLPERPPPPRNPEVSLPTIGNISREKLLEKVLPNEVHRQNKTEELWIPIPDDVIDYYVTLGRPTPLFRAIHLEKFLKTPAEIYIKREDVLPTGSFKINTAIPQAYYCKNENKFSGLVSETGAGQWGTALALSCSFMQLETIVFMARISYLQKPYRRILMELLNAKVYPSPSDLTWAGKTFLEKRSDHPGSIGIAISEAIEYAYFNDRIGYAIGSNFPFVLAHQTIVGLECMKQLERVDKSPDTVIACTGGGSCFASIGFPFLAKRLKEKAEIKFIIAESAAAPRLTKGQYKYDFADAVGYAPLVKAFTLGHDYLPSPVHVGGLRQHGGSPTIAILRKLGLVDAFAYTQEEALEAGRTFLLTEGMLPAPETCHAIKTVIDEALRAKEESQHKVILALFSGHGLLDLSGYEEVSLKGLKVS